MCWAQPSAGDSVDYKWVLNHLLCTVFFFFSLPQQKIWASKILCSHHAFSGKAVKTQWPLRVSFCALPEPVAEMWHLASLQASTLISTESSRMWTKPEMLILLLVLVRCWWRGFISWRPTQQYYKEVKAHPAVTPWPEWPWWEQSHFPAVWGHTYLSMLTPLSPRVLDDFGDSILIDIWYP